MSENKLPLDHKKRKEKTLLLCQSAIIAALYVALTFVFAPISFGVVQVRIAEALTILPIFTPAGISGLTVGCLLGNFLGGGVPMDVLFGTLATLLGAIGTYLLRKKHPLLGTIPPIVANTLIIPFVLKYAYGESLSIPIIMLTVGAGEILSCGVLGGLLALALKKRPGIFPSEKKQ